MHLMPDDLNLSRAGRVGASWGVLVGGVIPTAVLMAIDVQAMAVLAPSIRAEFHFTISQTTQLLSFAIAMYALCQIPAGWLAERVGPYRMLVGACATWSLAVFCLPFGKSFAAFAFARIMMGLCQSPDWASSILIIRERFPIAMRARASSGLLSGLYLGMVIGGPTCVFLMAHGGWKTSFHVLGLAGFGLAVCLFVVFRRNIMGKRELSFEPQRSTDFDFTLFRRPQFLAIGLSYMFLVGVQSFFTVLMPLYLVEVRHLAVASMGKVISIPFMCLYGSVILFGFISDLIAKRARNVWYARVPLGICGVLGAGGCLLMALNATSVTATVIFLSIALFMIGMAQVAIWCSVQDLGRQNPGVVVGWTQLLGNGASALVPVICAALIQRYGGWDVVRYVVAFSAMGGVLSFLVVNPQRPLSRIAAKSI